MARVARAKRDLEIKKKSLPFFDLKAEIRPLRSPAEIIPARFQREALAAAQAGKDVLVFAPTGAGKTWIAERLIAEVLAEKEARLIYTAPLKALSNQKYRNFCSLFGEESVGIVTGDIQIREEAPVVVMTTEIFRSMCLTQDYRLENVRYGILDEFHWLDSDRGTVWEEIVVFTPPQIRLLYLSATAPNSKELAGWITKARNRPVAVVVETERPVPLVWRWYAQGEILSQRALKNYLPRLLTSLGKQRKQKKRPSFQEPWADLVATLIQKEHYPALIFLFSRAQVENQARKIARSFKLLSPKEANFIEAYIQEQVPEEILKLHPLLWNSLERGIGFHHAGLSPTAKRVVEELFEMGYLPVIFCTETFALGVNFPARAVVIGSLTKRDDTGYRPLSPNEILQIAGRAGRRGTDEVGFIYFFIDERYPHEVYLAPPEAPTPVRSQFRVTPSSALRLAGQVGDQRARRLFQKSLAAYQAQASAPNRPAQELYRAYLAYKKKLIIHGFLALPEEPGPAFLTPQGEFAVSVGVGGLLFALLIKNGIFTPHQKDPALVAGLAAGVTAEEDLPFLPPPPYLPAWLKKIFTAFPLTKVAQDLNLGFDYEATLATAAWARGAELTEIWEEMNIFPGDFVSFARRGAEILRHSTQALPFLEREDLLPLFKEATAAIWQREVAAVF